MNVPLPAPLDLQQLLTTLEAEYSSMDLLRDQIKYKLPEVQYEDKDNSLRLYTSLCTILSTQLGQYMRLRRLILLPYLNDLLDKEEDGHDCRSCGDNCNIRHASHLASIREAHDELNELREHIQLVATSLNSAQVDFPEMYRSLRIDVMELVDKLNKVLFIEEEALIPMIIDLQRNIGAHE